jgi:hypothetical protein
MMNEAFRARHAEGVAESGSLAENCNRARQSHRGQYTERTSSEGELRVTEREVVVNVGA